MPKKRPIIETVASEPPEYIDFLHPSGITTQFLVLLALDQPEKRVVQCELCEAKISLSHGIRRFAEHRDSDVCRREVKRQGKKLEKLAREVVESGPTTPPSNERFTATAPSTPVVDVRTPRQSYFDYQPTSTSSSFPPDSPVVYDSDFDPEALLSMDLLDLDNLDDAAYESNHDDASESSGSEEQEEVDENGFLKVSDGCTGAPLKWVAGPVWDTYTYGEHVEDFLGFKPVAFDDDGWIRLRSDACKIFLYDDHELNSRICSTCRSLLKSRKLLNFMKRAKMPDQPAHTPWKYLNARQLQRLLAKAAKQNTNYRAQHRIDRRQISRLEKKVNDFQRILVLLSMNKVPGVSRLLSMSLRKGETPEKVGLRLQQAIQGDYRPRSGWTEREYDIAFLVKAIGGPRLLYALQKAEGYPSLSTLRRRKPIPELNISVGTPTASEMKKNISSFLGEKGRPPPKNPLVGQVLEIDGVALEEVGRFDLCQNCVVGMCREHSGGLNLNVNCNEDIQGMRNAVDDGRVHYGKDGTVLGLAPVTDATNYYVVPLVLSASCKAEKGEALASWINCFLDAYHASSNGEARHGPVVAIATDGESSFRKMRFTLGLSEDLDPNSKIGRILYQMPGMNCRTGRRQILGTCDPKHIVKRFATMLRSPTGIQVGNTLITPAQIISALEHLDGMTHEQASLLLDPADKQNVPKAVNLLQDLFDLDKTKKSVGHSISYYKRFKSIIFIGKVLNYFLRPFIKVEMSLSEQLRELSAYAHLITALYQKHKLSFLTGALLADSQAIVKNIFFNVARLKILDPTQSYYILFEGTDRLEGLFSCVRTQDHAPNFDILQLAHKLSIGAELNAVLNRHPDLDRGHIRRSLLDARGVDHINPQSWCGDVMLDKVDEVRCYLDGRDAANRLIIEYLGTNEEVDFNRLFSAPGVDHLRPGGGEYIGCRMGDEREYEDGPVSGRLQPHENANSQEELPTEDPRESVDVDEHNEPRIHVSSELNPSLTVNETQFLVVGGRKRGKPELVAELLSGSDAARKVTNRPLRAVGQSKEAALRRLRGVMFKKTSEPQGDSTLVKMGDPGAVLVRTGNTVCLAVVEALSFQQAGRSVMIEVDIDDLDSNGEKKTSVIIQILELLPFDNTEPGETLDTPADAVPGVRQPSGDDFLWVWNQQYLRIKDRKGEDETTSKRDLSLSIPGSTFFPVAAELAETSTEETPAWLFENASLRRIWDVAWDELNPESSQFLRNVKMLPEIKDPGLPYRLLNKDPQLCQSGAILDETSGGKLKAKDRVPCRLCEAIVLLNKMRRHVGHHLLHYQRGQSSGTFSGQKQIGEHPCGWCGLEGCKVQLVLTAKKPVKIFSDCPYHYKTMNYTKALESKDRAPCTNVPLFCPIAECGQTFWKYNFIQHMAEWHLTEAGNLPMCHPEHAISAHTTSAEEKRMGIEVERTIKFRQTNRALGVFDSDDITFYREELESRKRAASDLSNISTNSRQKSPSKRGRRDGN